MTRSLKPIVFAVTLAVGSLLAMGQARIVPSRWSVPFTWFGDGTAAAPSLARQADPTTGMYFPGTSLIGWAVGGVRYLDLDPTGSGTLRYENGLGIGFAAANGSPDAIIGRLGAGKLDLIGTGTPTVKWDASAAITASASQAAGGTVNDTGTLPDYRYQVTISPAAGDCSTAFNAAALTADCTIATLKAGQKLVGVYADVTAGFTCSATCTGTKVLQAGTAAGGTQILAAGLNVAVTGTFGLADTDLGSGMTRAAAIQGGLIGSWSTTTPVSVRFTSGTGNWGTGAATNVNAGTVTFTLLTKQVR